MRIARLLTVLLVICLCDLAHAQVARESTVTVRVSRRRASTTQPARSPSTQPAPASQPASTPPVTLPADPQIAQAKQQMQAAIETYTRMLSDDDPQKRQQADLALRTLVTVAAMQARNAVDTDDPEAVNRLEMILDYSARAMRHGELMTRLTPEQRTEVAKVIREHRGRYRQLFSRDPNAQMHAILELGKQGPGGQIILQWACRQPTWVLRMAAYRVAGELEKPSDDLKDALFARLSDARNAIQLPPPNGDPDDMEMQMRMHIMSQVGGESAFSASSERNAIYQTLAKAKDSRIMPWLLGELEENDEYSYGWHGGSKTEFLRLMGKLEDPRAVVTLVAKLDGTSEEVTSGSVNGDDYSVESVDYLLAALIDMTGQKRDDYKMGLDNDWDDEDMKVAFKTTADREAAIKKFKAWYKENAETYKDLTPYTPKKVTGESTGFTSEIWVD